LTVTLNIQDTSGHNYSCHLDNQTTIKDIVHDFFESMEWPLQDSHGNGQKAVAEFLDPNTGEYIRLRSDQTLEEANIPDGAVLRFYPEPTAGCFEGTTQITLADNSTRPIERLRAGDIVQTASFDELGRLIISSSAIYEISTKKAETIFVINGSLHVSGSQRIWSEGRLTQVSAINAGDFLTGRDGKKIIVEKITQYYFSEPVTLYNLVFENPLTNFFAGGILSGDLASKLADPISGNGNPASDQKVILKVISLFDPFPTNTYTIAVDPSWSTQKMLSILSPDIPGEKASEGLVLCKESGTILNSYGAIGRQKINTGNNLIWGDVSQILDLHERQELLARIPNEIIQQGIKKTLRYLEVLLSEDDSSPHKLLECKLAFLGSGFVGKTSLISMLRTGNFDPGCQKTNGIEIHDDLIIWRDEDPVKVNTWDFGGQEINYSTHKCFLTERTAYVIVTSPRIDDYHSETDLEYWLKLISNYAPGSPVVIALNKSDEHSLKIAKDTFRQNYPQIVGFAETSCLKKTGIEDLRGLIIEAIRKMPHIDDLLPPHYFIAKGKIRKAVGNYLDYATYRSICQEVSDKFNEDDTQILLMLLNDLGIMLSGSKDRLLKDTHILNPEWITKGFYQLMDSSQLKDNNGRITEEDILSVLDKDIYPEISDVRILLNIMSQYKLCYRTNEHFLSTGESRYIYYFPTLFPPDIPMGIHIGENRAGIIRFYYQYTINPYDVFLMFVVNNHFRIHSYWRWGCVYASSVPGDGPAALIYADRSEKRILIEIIGSDNKRLHLNILMEQFRSINQVLIKSEVKEFIMDYETSTVPIEINDLKVHEEEGRKTIFIARIRKELSVQKLLYGNGQSTDNRFEQIFEMIKQNQLEKAISLLNRLLPEEDDLDSTGNAWIILQNRYHSLVKQQQLYNRDEYNLFLTRWISDFLEFVREVKKLIS
jgi:small GTP-binding protein